MIMLNINFRIKLFLITIMVKIYIKYEQCLNRFYYLINLLLKILGTFWL